MTTVLVLGSGMVVRPLVDYLLESCGYRVILTHPTVEGAARVIRGRPLGVPAAWTASDITGLHLLVEEADVVVSMLPPHLHLEVARACLVRRRHLVTTSYISEGMASFDALARDCDLVFLNEVGESPGLDHMSAVALIHRMRDAGQEVVSLQSLAGGLPAFRWNTNPWGYKFAWSPRGVFKAAESPAVFLDGGTRVAIPGGEVFGWCRPVAIQGVGLFETYPNRDATRYLASYGLAPDVFFYRGLLRHPGWCALMRALMALGMLDDTVVRRFAGMTHARLLAEMARLDAGDLPATVARYLGLLPDDPVIRRLEWIGLFSASPVMRSEGTALDVLLDLAVPSLAYGPDEQDMVVVYAEAVTSAGELTRHAATLMAEGIPHGDSAMARAVGFTAGIATRLILERAIRERGVMGPFSADIWRPVLDEMEGRGFRFSLCSSARPDTG